MWFGYFWICQQILLSGVAPSCWEWTLLTVIICSPCSTPPEVTPNQADMGDDLEPICLTRKGREFGSTLPNDCLFFTKPSCYCGDGILSKLDESRMPAITWSNTLPTHSHGLGRFIFREEPKVMTAHHSSRGEHLKFWKQQHSTPQIPIPLIDRWLNWGFDPMFWWRYNVFFSFDFLDWVI